MSIPATVKERSGNCVRVHFHIDPEYDNSPNVKYFTYAIESSFIYCMPEVGSQVHIYFPGMMRKMLLQFMPSGHPAVPPHPVMHRYRTTNLFPM